MRFLEFYNSQPKGYYAIGDSIASNLAASGGENWGNLAQPGTTATTISSNKLISSIPPGSVIAVSVGMEDAKSADMPEIIGKNVATAVNDLKKYGTVVYILFPESIAQGSEKLSAVRNSILSSLGRSVPILDMERKEGGIAQFDVLAKQIMMFIKPTSQMIGQAGKSTSASPAIGAGSATGGKVGQVLDFIAKYESRGNYNIILGGKTVPLTTMTISQVYDLQRQMKRSGKESTAVGRYQYIHNTLKERVRQMGLNPNTTLFNERTQDQIATYELKRCGLNEWMAGRMSDRAFLDRVAGVWASIPNPRTGQSAFKGVGSNKALVSAGSALGTLQNIRMA